MLIHVYRITIETSSSTLASNKILRRPFGCAVVSTSELTSESETKSIPLLLFSCASSDWHRLHTLLSNKSTAKFTPVIGSELELTARQWRGDFVSAVDDSLPRTISQSFLQTAIFTSSDCTENEISLQILSGQFPEKTTSRKQPIKSVFLTLQLISANGQMIKNCFGDDCSSTSANEHFTAVLASAATVTWNAPVTLRLPAAQLPGAHLRILCSRRESDAKRPTTLFGFAFLPIFDSNAIVRSNGTYRLSVFKCDNVNKLKDPSKYQRLSWRRLEEGEASVMPQISLPAFPTALRYSLYIHFALNYNLLNQQQEMIASVEREKCRNCVDDVSLASLVTGIDEHTAFSTLSALLDALLDRLSENSSAFDCLQRIFLRATDSQCVQSKLRRYLRENWKHPQLFCPLLEQTLAMLTNHETPQPSVPVIGWSVRFVYRSLKWTTLDHQICSALFERLFDSLAAFVVNSSRRPNDRLLVLNDFSELTAELAKVVDQRILAVCVRAVVTKLVVTAFCSCEFDDSRLKLFTSFILMDVFKIQDNIEVIECIMSQMQTHLNAHTSIPNIIECFTALLEKCNKMTVKSEARQKIIIKVVQMLFEPLVSCIISTDRDDQQLQWMFICFYQLLSMMNRSSYSALMDSLKKSGNKKRAKDVFLRILLIFRDVVKTSECKESCENGKVLFPTRWKQLKFKLNNLTMVSLEAVGEILRSDFFSENDFDTQLWQTYMALCTAFVAQPLLQSEKVQLLSHSPLSEAIKKYGDMRVPMCYQLGSIWTLLNERQYYFVPSMVGSFLELSLIPNVKLRRIAMPLLAKMLTTKPSNAGTISLVENEIFDKIDVFFSEEKGDLEFKEELIKYIELEAKNSQLEESEKKRLKDLSEKLGRLIDMLLELNSLKESESFYRRASSLEKLIQFYKNDLIRWENCFRFVDSLQRQLSANECRAEAAVCSQFKADTLVCCSSSTNSPLHQALKEKLYMDAIHQYTQAKLWERAISLCFELINFYRHIVYDFEKLSKILRQTSDMYASILREEDGPQTGYFRVQLRGPVFAPTFSNRTFIFRSINNYDNLAAFADRFHQEWPRTVLITRTNDPRLRDNDPNLSYVHISRVRAVVEKSAATVGEGRQQMPPIVQTYYKNNDVSVFEMVRPSRRGNSYGSFDSTRSSDFQTLWTERTVILTQDRLPTIVPWSPVISESTELISPVKTACQCIREKNTELKRVTDNGQKLLNRQQPQDEQRSSIQQLLMILKGTIEAAVNGGILVYQNAFFSPTYCQQYPEEVDNLNELRRGVREQLFLLDRGLDLSAKLVSADCRPLHAYMVKVYARLCKDVSNGLDTPEMRRALVRGDRNSLPPPTPPDRRASYRSDILNCATHLMIQSYDSALGAHFDLSESEMSCSGARSDFDDDWPMVNCLSNGNNGWRQKTDPKSQQGKQSQFESSLESIGGDESTSTDHHIHQSKNSIDQSQKKASRMGKLVSRLTECRAVARLSMDGNSLFRRNRTPRPLSFAALDNNQNRKLGRFDRLIESVSFGHNSDNQ